MVTGPDEMNVAGKIMGTMTFFFIFFLILPLFSSLASTNAVTAVPCCVVYITLLAASMDGRVIDGGEVGWVPTPSPRGLCRVVYITLHDTSC